MNSIGTCDASISAQKDQLQLADSEDEAVWAEKLGILPSKSEPRIYPVFTISQSTDRLIPRQSRGHSQIRFRPHSAMLLRQILTIFVGPVLQTSGCVCH